MIELTTSYLVDQTRNLLNAVRGSSIKIGANLYHIKEQLSKEQDWGDFIRDEFDISESFASKLMTVYRVYVLEGGITQDRLETIDAEKLYLARELTGDIEEKLAKANQLTRSDLRREFQDDKPHEFEAREVCKKCGAIRENHS